VPQIMVDICAETTVASAA